MSDQKIIPIKKEIQVILSREKIERGVKAIAAWLEKVFEKRYPLIVGVLNGSIYYMADVSRLMRIPHELAFVRVSSYRKGEIQATQLELAMCAGFGEMVRDRDVVVLDTIIDSGRTMKLLTGTILKSHPKSLTVATLIDKAPQNRKEEGKLDASIKSVTAFTVPLDYFLLGYGLDYRGFFRELPDIITLESYRHKTGIIDSILDGEEPLPGTDTESIMNEVMVGVKIDEEE